MAVHRSTSTRAGRLVAALATALLLPACSSSGGSAGAPATPAADAPTTSPSVSPSDPGPPSTAVTGSSRPPPPARPTRSAANGTDVAACRDGRCEVFVRGRVAVPLDPRFGFTSFTVTFISPDRTLFFGTDPARGNLRGEVGGTGELSSNGITVRIISVGPAGAVLRFTPRP